MFRANCSLEPILLAIQFLTRVPIPFRHKPNDREWARSMAWFPLVGLMVGLLVAGTRYLVSCFWPGDIAAALSLAIWIMVTGGLHLDGFVDCCDALVAAVPPQRRLEILRDVHVGTYGLVGAVTLLLVKWLAISKGDWNSLVTAPILGRWAMVYVTFCFPYARAEGLGKVFKDGLTWREFLLASILSLTAVFAFARWQGLVTMAGISLIAWLLGKWARRQLGAGVTGDVYGMECEIAEVVAMLMMGALLD